MFHRRNVLLFPIGNQRELIRDFVAERPELHLVGEYADDGYTGTNFERPGFTQMMEDIKSGKINCIIVKDLKRDTILKPYFHF